MLSSIEQEIFFQIESRRDGCSREYLYCHFTDKKIKELLIKDNFEFCKILTTMELEDIINNFIKKEYLYEASGLIFINYEKVKININDSVEII